MPNPIFDAMNARGPQPRSMNIIQQYNQFKQDPFTFMLQNKGIQIPEEYRNNPQGAVNYLMQSGQMTPEQLEYTKGLARRMGLQI